MDWAWPVYFSDTLFSTVLTRDLEILIAYWRFFLFYKVLKSDWNKSVLIKISKSIIVSTLVIRDNRRLNNLCWFFVHYFRFFQINVSPNSLCLPTPMACKIFSNQSILHNQRLLIIPKVFRSRHLSVPCLPPVPFCR